MLRGKIKGEAGKDGQSLFQKGRFREALLVERHVRRHGGKEGQSRRTSQGRGQHAHRGSQNVTVRRSVGIVTPVASLYSLGKWDPDEAKPQAQLHKDTSLVRWGKKRRKMSTSVRQRLCQNIQPNV